ncbi:Hydrogenase-4 component B / Formate hydrogenlyase subunit 3 [Anaerovibrio sp. JC8]|uniref:proton-conducting transporter transmembrane domain-containing protein n=1 Tax=Anaerovibrio sp. JC8 TaxID=1240085 RepID=UPI000A0C0D08|nr:proton-conducting transporter membrane subunit [Anaerovibrio sp. JC8]ORU00659.1 Hydrogenase-4 component B / Formate hydrogenlyase subunit 3 [Anaerovibrio sp. JC8]
MDFMIISLLVYLLGTVTLIWPKKAELGAHYFGMLCSVVASGLVVFSTLRYLLTTDNNWLIDLAWGSYTLQADGWSGAFLLLTGVAGVIISLYAIDYGKGYIGSRIRALSGLWNLFLLSIVLVLISGDAFTFIISWEVMALVSFMLVYHESEKKKTVSAAYQYMVMTHIGTAAIMVAFYLVASTAESFSFVDMARNNLTGYMKDAAFLFAFAGFALKSGLMPLHIWLPNAHPAAPSHVSALMSGVMLKVAVYGFGRFAFQFIGMDVFWYGLLVMLLGLISAFLGVLYAVMEVDMKRILAYSSVENMGIIFAAFGCGMVLYSMGMPMLSVVAFTAVLVHAVSHSFMKGLLFMSAGCVMHATGSKNIEHMGGLARKMPYTALFTLIGSMALASMPFTSGLVGEWLTLQSYITLAQQAGSPEMRLLVVFAFILLGLTGATALGCFVRMYGIAFLGRARTHIVEKAHEMPFFMLLGLGMEAFLIVFVGLMPDYLVNLMQRVVSGTGIAPMGNPIGIIWGGSGHYALYSPALIFIVFVLIGVFMVAALYRSSTFVTKDVTWNCGTVPTSRQQYSATGFSKPLRRAFDGILNPKRRTTYLRKEHAYFGRKLHYELSIPDLFNDKLYKPIQQMMINSSSSFHKIQEGSVSIYIGYTMVAMIVVLIWGVLL